MSTHSHGYDCMCGGVHPLPPGPPVRPLASPSGSSSGSSDESPAATSSELAPVPAFLSPFTEAQEVATRNVLAQIHPDLAVSRTALTLLMRMQDALAHYLLLRAFKGQNPAHRPGRGPNAPAEDEQMEEHADTFALQESDPSHAIHFVFPSSVYAPQLCAHAETERVKAVQKFVTGEVHQLPQPDFFQFSQEVAVRWFADFATGIERGESGAEAKAEAKRRAQAKEEAEERRTGKKKKAKATADVAVQAGAGSSESKEAEPQSPPNLELLPEVLQTPLEQISLAAVVEYMSAELLELGGNRALDRGAGCLQPLDIWVSIAQDEELRSLAKFLHTCWSTSGSDALASPLDAARIPANAPAESFGLPPLTLMLDAEFAMAQKALGTVNATSWYNNAAKVKEYARAFARGDLRMSPVSRALAELQVRPIQFYGCDNHTLLSEKPPEQEHWAQTGADAWSFVRFGVTDRAEHEWQFLLEIAPNQSWKGCVSELAWAGAAVGFLQRSARDGTDTLTVNLSACSSIGDEAGRTYQPRVTDVDELEAEIVSQLAKLKEKLDAHRKSKEEGAAAKKDSAAAAVPIPTLEPVQRVVEALVDTVAVAAERDQAENGEEERKESDNASASDDAASGLSLGSLSLNDSSSSSSTSAITAAPATASSSSSSSTGSFDPFAIFAPAARKAPAKPTALAKLKLARAGVAPADIAAAAAAAAAAVPKPPTLMLGSTSRLSSLSTLLGSVPTHVSNSQVQSELEGTVARILHIALFSRYGPTFYTHCHPAAARRAFTVELLDEAMALAPTVDLSAPADSDTAAAAAPVSASAVPAATPSPALPQLPIVLLDLIAQYHSFDLPFIEDEAARQLKSANWLPQPANRSSYTGQTNNPVERLGQLQTEADEILEPIELEPLDGEEGEDEEFDEDEDDEEGEDEEGDE